MKTIMLIFLTSLSVLSVAQAREASPAQDARLDRMLFSDTQRKPASEEVNPAPVQTQTKKAHSCSE